MVGLGFGVFILFSEIYVNKLLVHIGLGPLQTPGTPQVTVGEPIIRKPEWHLNRQVELDALFPPEQLRCPLSG